MSNVQNMSLEDIMGDRFGRYSKYIIQERALPDMSAVLLPMPTRAGRESLKRHPAVPCLWMK